MAARSSALRVGRFSAVGQVYLITTITQERAPLFADFWAARTCVTELQRSDHIGCCTTLAYVLMPDHLHWMVQLSRGRLPDLIRNFKASSSRKINEMDEIPGRRCWQRGYHDRAIRDDQELKVAARYLVANPLRAGLVARLADYPHWDATWL
jgi:putative transposase